MSNDAPPRDTAEARAVKVVVHPPERFRGRSSVPAQAGHCGCCCCCCCLHSLGALIGAAVAPNIGGGPKPRNYLPLTYYWDEEDYQIDPGAASTRTREGITAELPSAARPLGESLPSYEAPREIALSTHGPSAVSLFWWSLLVLVGIGLLLSILGGPSGMVFGGIIILLVLPGLQLGAAIFSALWLATSTRPDLGYQFRQLGKIVLGLVGGTVAGILIMVAMYMVLSRR